LLSLIYLLVELVVSFALGRLIGIIIKWFFKFKINKYLKVTILISLGYAVYLFADWLGDFTVQEHILGHKFYIEPLLICILGSYYVTNYSTSRPEFIEILHETGPVIYVIFFTLTGATLQVDVLFQVFGIAVLFFFIRLLSMVIAGYVGGTLAGDPWKFRHLNWMPYVTQAGVGLGLATLIKQAFPEFGVQFETIIVGVIVINQVVGPPLFKFALHKVNETHEKHETPAFDGHNDAIIFGFEPMSLALARQLKNNGWGVKIAAMRKADEIGSVDDIDIVFMDSISLSCLSKLDPKSADTMVLMLSDRENYQWCELIYEQIGTKEIVVRASGDRYYAKKFKALEALVVDPNSAMVNLMDHFVRSPNATSILLGMETDQDAVDVEIMDATIQGLALRDLRLPSDILILSISRNDQLMITHGYTRLRVGDIVTILGSQESIDKVELMFGPT
ncbi:MAG: potassium transporter TrkA, partial [Flavobacteriales bacterium]|nr:potassium transporter TrkA [Flavobacteriales bacterium]